MNGKSAQAWARLAGVLFLLSFLGGGFGEAYVPSMLIVRGDAIATAKNIAAHDALFRLGFAAYLVEALCDIALTGILYALLKRVQREVALLSVLFGLVSTAVFAVAELFYFAPSLTLQPDVLLLALKMYGMVGNAFMVFYGMASLLRGWLIYRSRFLPRWLGILLMIAGGGFIAKNVAFVLAPAYARDLLMLPTVVAALALAVWFLWRGVDVERWNAGVRAGWRAGVPPAT